MRVLDLFSGIGGFSLGLERAGMQTVAFCEIEDYPQRVLAKHWPGVPIHGDIRKLDGRQYRGTVNVVCGGFPCQPFSVAGDQRGEDDDRDLWPEMFRVIREVQPAWVIGENVAGFINMELDRTLSDLESAGYACQTFEIPACAVDAPHERMRVWIVAHADKDGIRDESEPERRRRGEAEPVIDGEARLMADTESGGARRRRDGPEAKHLHGGADVANPSGPGLEGHERALRTQTKHAAASDACRWLPEPDVGRVATGVPNRVDRLRGLGNAVVPQIPEIIGRAIMQHV